MWYHSVEVMKMFVDEIPEREIRQLPVDKICPDPRRVAVKISKSELRRAAAHMRKCFGAPIRVSPAPACELYMLMSDEKRFRAALLLGLKYVPCEIYEESVVSRAKIALSDPRFLINSIFRLVDTSKRAGIDATCERSDNGGTTTVTVTVKHK